MERLESKIVLLGNEKYLVYLKRVKVKSSKEGKNGTIIRAFVKKLGGKTNKNQNRKV